MKLYYVGKHLPQGWYEVKDESVDERIQTGDWHHDQLVAVKPKKKEK